jgi:anti-sigma B factor antagonist
MKRIWIDTAGLTTRIVFPSPGNGQWQSCRGGPRFSLPCFHAGTYTDDEHQSPVLPDVCRGEAIVEISIEKVRGVNVIVLAVDSLDASNTTEFKRAFAPAVEPNARVVLDLSRVQFIDSSGCGAILALLRQLTQAGGDLKLCSVSRPVKSLFELVRMHRILEICDDRESAIRAFQAGA